MKIVVLGKCEYIFFSSEFLFFFSFIKLSPSNKKDSPRKWIFFALFLLLIFHYKSLKDQSFFALFVSMIIFIFFSIFIHFLNIVLVAAIQTYERKIISLNESNIIRVFFYLASIFSLNFWQTSGNDFFSFSLSLFFDVITSVFIHTTTHTHT